MGITDYFKPVKSMTAEEVREFLKNKDLGEYNLVDVRQPKEYERGHIPERDLSLWENFVTISKNSIRISPP